MNDTPRESLIAKVKALLAKTLANGCTEQEAATALAKAQAMIDAYEISDHELTLTRQQKAVLSTCDSNDPHDIKEQLACAIAAFTHTRCWHTTNGITYCGLKADTEFASWLTDSLTLFIQGELADYLIEIALTPTTQRRNRRTIINGFIQGATTRISARLYQLVASRTQPTTTNGRALVAIQTTAISDYLTEHNISFYQRHQPIRKCDPSAHDAGTAAGNRASFGRPIDNCDTNRLSIGISPHAH